MKLIFLTAWVILVPTSKFMKNGLKIYQKKFLMVIYK